MNFGRFFALDKDSSQFGNGIVIFHYTAIKDVEETLENSREETLRYPIYLTLSKDSIEFIYHYCIKDTTEGKHKHFHNSILSLPLSSNLEIKDGLTSALIEASQTPFTYHNSAVINEEKKEISYSNLTDFFGINIDGKFKKDSFFLHKLILDFLFDFEHTSVFQNSPYYEYISIKLKENYFFNSLANKAMFYYYKNLFKEAYKKDYKHNFFYAERLFNAEKEWTKSIRDIKSDQAFHDSKGWFDSPEVEMKGIYKSKEKDKTVSVRKELYAEAIKADKQNNTLLKYAIKLDSKLSSQWNIKRCAFSNLFTTSQNVVLSILMLIPFFNLILFFCNLFTDYSFLHFGVSLQLIAYSFLFLIVILGVGLFSELKYSFGSHIYFPRLLIAILTGWVTIFFGTTLFSPSSINQVTNNPYTITLGILIMLLALAWFTYIEMGRLSPYIGKSRRFRRTLYFLLISFFYSHMSGFFLSFLTKIRELEFDKNAILNEIYHLRNSTEPELLFDSGTILVFYLFTFLAMFIGLFLNIMLLEKRATEAL